MSGTPLVLVVNPVAGGGRAGEAAQTVADRLLGLGHSVELQMTQSSLHATELARGTAERGRVVAAMGGDGLVSAVVNGLVGHPAGTLAVIPFGRGNDFARFLGIKSLDQALSVLSSGRSKSVDLGKAGDRYFTCIASVGFDSRVIEKADSERLIRGPLVYPYATVKSLFGWKPAHFQVEFDGHVESMVGYNVAIANSGYYGGGMKMAPTASIDDGLLDVVTIGEVTKLRFLIEGLKVFRGGHVGHPAVHLRQTRRITVTCDEPFTFYADGEVLGPGPMTFESCPKAIMCLVPA